jgi:hypothetical protein
MVRGGSIIFSLLFVASVIANAAAAGEAPAQVVTAKCAETSGVPAGRLDVRPTGTARWWHGIRTGNGSGDGNGNGTRHGNGTAMPPPGGGTPGSTPAPGTTPAPGPAPATPTGTTGGEAGTSASPCEGPPPDPAPGAVAGDGTLPPAAAGQTVNVEPTRGAVLVRQPGSRSFEPLTTSAQVPAGSVIDTTAGNIELTSGGNAGRQQTAAFGGGRFEVRQRRGKALTELVLRGGSFGRCKRARARGGVTASGARSRRHLWGSGHGKFRTRGRHGSATVRGTVWNVEDRCDGTRVTVRRGVVRVADFHRRRTVTVSAGESYLARARLRTSR